MSGEAIHRLRTGSLAAPGQFRPGRECWPYGHRRADRHADGGRSGGQDRDTHWDADSGANGHGYPDSDARPGNRDAGSDRHPDRHGDCLTHSGVDGHPNGAADRHSNHPAHGHAERVSGADWYANRRSDRHSFAYRGDLALANRDSRGDGRRHRGVDPRDSGGAAPTTSARLHNGCHSDGHPDRFSHQHADRYFDADGDRDSD